MNLSFLVPAALIAGLAALAIPVLIHLVRSDRSRVIDYPSLMFLRRIPHKSTRRRVIKNWPLLLLRALAFTLIALAFARPLLDRETPAGIVTTGPIERVVLLDRSYSMGYADRWTRAIAAARRAIQDARPEDRVNLVIFDTGVRSSLLAGSEPGRQLAVLDTLRPGAGATRFAPALKLAGSILEASSLPNREVVLISDFQRSAWEAGEPTRLPPGAGLTPIDVVGNEPVANVAVTDVTFQRRIFAGGERITASARVAYKGEAPIAGLQIDLELDGRVQQSRNLDLAPNSAASVQFDPFTLAGGTIRGSVRADPRVDALPIDNVFHFLVSSAQATPVLIVESGRSAASLYLSRALAVGEPAPFRTETRAVEQLRPAHLDAVRVVVLNDVPFPRGELGRRLQTFVEDGGGLLVVLGETATAAEPSAELLPGSFGPPLNRDGRAGVLAWFDTGHPVFEIFAAPRSGDFTAARFYRARSLTLDDDASVLARFGDGSTALAERIVGSGRVALWASTMDREWNDLALQPVFVPFAHRLVRYLSGQTEAAPWFTVGQILAVGETQPIAVAAEEPAVADDATSEAAQATANAAPVAVSARSNAVVITPAGRRVSLADDRGSLLELLEQGFFEVRSTESGDAAVLTVASNLDLRESDLAAMDAAELAASLTLPAGTEQAAAASGEVDRAAQRSARERRQAIWWYLLLGALLLLGGETVLANRLSRRA